MSKPADLAYHGLFLPEEGLNQDFEAEPIGKIYVKRFDAGGESRVPQWFSPDALREPSDIFTRWGGGSYEVVARRPDGSIYAKRLYTFPGAPKPLVDPAAAPASSAALEPSRAIPAGIDPMLAMMMQQQNDAAARSQALILGLATAFAPVVAALVAGKKEEHGSSPAELITAIAAMAQANKPAPPAPPTPLSEVLTLNKIIREEANAQSNAAADQAKRNAPEESIGDTIKTVIEAAGPLLMALPSVAPVVPKLGP